MASSACRARSWWREFTLRPYADARQRLAQRARLGCGDQLDARPRRAPELAQQVDELADVRPALGEQLARRAAAGQDPALGQVAVDRLDERQRAADSTVITSSVARRAAAT
jgi:hypothetical protein